MLIGNNWKIEADKLNVIISRKHSGDKNPRTGETSTKVFWSIEGYYSNMRDALRAMVEQEVRDTQLKDLQVIVAKQEELYELIKTFPGKLLP